MKQHYNLQSHCHFQFKTCVCARAPLKSFADILEYVLNLHPQLCSPLNIVSQSMISESIAEPLAECVEMQIPRPYLRLSTVSISGVGPGICQGILPQAQV